MVRSSRPVLAWATLAALCCGLGADSPEKTQTIDAQGMTFEAPTSWESVPTRERFRRAVLKVPPTEGDKDPGELVVTSLFSDGGGVEPNVKRWEGMFQPEGDATAKAEVSDAKGTNVDVTVVDVSGHYVASVRPGDPRKLDKPGYRLLGVIVVGKQASFFLKLTGPAATLKAAKPAFDEMVKSITLKEE